MYAAMLAAQELPFWQDPAFVSLCVFSLFCALFAGFRFGGIRRQSTIQLVPHFEDFDDKLEGLSSEHVQYLCMLSRVDRERAHSLIRNANFRNTDESTMMLSAMRLRSKVDWLWNRALHRRLQLFAGVVAAPAPAVLQPLVIFQIPHVFVWFAVLLLGLAAGFGLSFAARPPDQLQFDELCQF